MALQSGGVDGDQLQSNPGANRGASARSGVLREWMGQDHPGTSSLPLLSFYTLSELW